MRDEFEDGEKVRAILGGAICGLALSAIVLLSLLLFASGTRP